MSKSLNNSILLSDDADTVRQKIMNMYTDPKRLRATDPGTVENNPLWIFHDIFTADKKWIDESKDKYRAGKIGDVDCKKKLIESIMTLLEPMQKRRKEFLGNEDHILSVLREGAEKANTIANKTLHDAKNFIRQLF